MRGFRKLIGDDWASEAMVWMYPGGAVSESAEVAEAIRANLALS